MIRSLYGHQDTARTPYECASIWRIGKIAEKSVKYQEKVSLSNLLKGFSNLNLKKKTESIEQTKFQHVYKNSNALKCYNTKIA